MFAIASFCLALGPAPVQAQDGQARSIKLNDGRTLMGQVMESTGEGMVMEVPQGRILVRYESLVEIGVIPDSELSNAADPRIGIAPVTGIGDNDGNLGRQLNSLLAESVTLIPNTVVLSAEMWAGELGARAEDLRACEGDVRCVRRHAAGLDLVYLLVPTVTGLDIGIPRLGMTALVAGTGTTLSGGQALLHLWDSRPDHVDPSRSAAMILDAAYAALAITPTLDVAAVAAKAFPPSSAPTPPQPVATADSTSPAPEPTSDSGPDSTATNQDTQAAEEAPADEQPPAPEEPLAGEPTAAADTDSTDEPPPTDEETPATSVDGSVTTKNTTTEETPPDEPSPEAAEPVEDAPAVADDSGAEAREETDDGTADESPTPDSSAVADVSEGEAAAPSETSGAETAGSDDKVAESETGDSEALDSSSSPWTIAPEPIQTRPISARELAKRTLTRKQVIALGFVPVPGLSSALMGDVPGFIIALAGTIGASWATVYIVGRTAKTGGAFWGPSLVAPYAFHLAFSQVSGLVAHKKMTGAARGQEPTATTGRLTPGATPLVVVGDDGQAHLSGAGLTLIGRF